MLFLRVTPNAGRDGIDGVEQRDDDTAVLRMRVAAVPDKGKANASVLALLAKTLGISKSSITLVSGELSRFKTVHVVGNIDVLVSRLSTLGLEPKSARDNPPHFPIA